MVEATLDEGCLSEEVVFELSLNNKDTEMQ